MYQGRHLKKAAKRRRNGRAGIVLLSLLLLATLAIGGTLAFLATSTDDVVNTFTPSKVTVKVEEEFDGSEKTNVNVTNTGNVDAYVRVKLVTYRVNENGDRIGGTATIPDFTPGTGWVKHTDGMYYYTSPVAPGQQPAANLADKISLVGSYEDADGGKQVIEVMAEAIQADGVDETGKKAVLAAWGVDPETLD